MEGSQVEVPKHQHEDLLELVEMLTEAVQSVKTGLDNLVMAYDAYVTRTNRRLLLIEREMQQFAQTPEG